MKKHLKHHKKNKIPKLKSEHIPTLNITTEREIAFDFAEKLYHKFDKLIKSVILFGSTAKDKNAEGSDIDIVIILDDATVRFDEKLIMWYREQLGQIIQANPYKKELHINTIKLTTWFDDLLRGDAVVINIIRYGEVIIDFGGFFTPLKVLLQDGKLKATPEAMYTILNRVPEHILRSKTSELGAIEGCYWAMVESAQALLMAVKILPPSPEHIGTLLKENFVDKNMLKSKYVSDLNELYELHRKVIHGEIRDIDGRIIDDWQNKSDDFFKTCLKLIDSIIQ